MPSLLAFDTATEHLFVGLRVGDREWVHEAVGGAQASAVLVPTVMDLLDRAGLAVGQLDAIAFGRGPGAFTGLRAAAAAAQGLAFGAGRPVIAIDSLMATAEDAREDDAPTTTWVAMDARMNEIYAALYAFDGRGWTTLAGPALHAPQALDARRTLQPADSIAGNALLAFPGLATGAARPVPGALPRAHALLSLAAAAWQRGESMDPALALPSYVRDKVAQTTLERDAVRRAREGLVLQADDGAAA